MAEAFGLRVRECMSLNPLASDCRDMLQVVHGTKGGLPRAVPFDSDPASRLRQRDVLERAKLMASKHPKGLLCRPGLSLQQNIWHFYDVLKKVGVTRKMLGVTAHGLRHQYGGRKYEEISGHRTPVSGGMPAQVSEETQAADLLARREVSRAMGHFRDDVTKAYVGSIPTMSRERKKRVADWVNLTEGNNRFQEVLKKYGVNSAWLGGRFASGLDVTPTERVRLFVAPNIPLAPGALVGLSKDLSDTLSRGVDVSEHHMAGPPDDCLEIFVRSKSESAFCEGRELGKLENKR